MALNNFESWPGINWPPLVISPQPHPHSFGRTFLGIVSHLCLMSKYTVPKGTGGGNPGAYLYSRQGRGRAVCSVIHFGLAPTRPQSRQAAFPHVAARLPLLGSFASHSCFLNQSGIAESFAAAYFESVFATDAVSVSLRIEAGKRRYLPSRMLGTRPLLAASSHQDAGTLERAAISCAVSNSGLV